MIIQIVASANGAKDFFNKTVSDVNRREVLHIQNTLKIMLNAKHQSPVFEFQDDDLGDVLINVKSYNFITVRTLEEHKM